MVNLHPNSTYFDDISPKGEKESVGNNEKQKDKFTENVKDWSQNTTFHGLRYIGKDTNLLRRLMWLMFVLACLVAVILQIVDRVGHFYDYPINVNVRINYNHTLTFPAVTICNQNAFRATEAARHGQYRLIEELFSNSPHITTDVLERYNATDIAVDELYTSLAHTKHDFIKQCYWKNRQCSKDDFQMVITDHGVCFSFTQDNSEMLVSSSGVDSGLRLTLNVEQYEYMTGPHDAAGIKILLHAPQELPLVHELGQAVPTGTHAFFGVKFMTIENLPKPHGECDTKTLSHTDYYTTEECYIDCLVKFAYDICGCRDSYMPHYSGSPPVCTLGEYYTCLRPLKNDFEQSLRHECGCPVPCQFAIYDPSVSYSSMSNHLVKKLLTTNEAGELRQNLEHASEVTAKMDNATFNKFHALVQTSLQTFSQVNDVIYSIQHCLNSLINKTQDYRDQMFSSYATKERMYRYQEYSIQKNFLRGYEAMEERTLANLANAYAEFALLNKNKITRLAFDRNASDDSRYELYTQIIDTIEARKGVVEMAQGNISLLFNAFIEGDPIFNYKFENLPRAHNKYIVPKPLMNYSMYHDSYMLKYVPKLNSSDIPLMIRTLDMYIEQATEAFENQTIDESRLNYVYERFQYACRTYMFSKSVVYSMGITLPLRTIEERHARFDDLWNMFDSEVTALKQNTHALDSLLENISSIVIPKFTSTESMLTNYSQENDNTLMDIAGQVLSNDSQQMVNTMKSFFRDVQIRGQLIDDTISLSLKPVREMWDMIVNDEDSYLYYNYTNNALFMRGYEEVEEEWASKVNELRSFDIRGHVQNKDQHFFTAIDALALHLDTFRSSIKVDSEFLKENFLQLDIFYRQLSYEYINQQKAYDFFALVSDIGGAMGLFIGASMLTILEVIDLFLIQIPIFKHNKETKKNTYAGNV